MNTCPTVKEVTMPGCYSGVLKVNTGLAPGTNIWVYIQKEGSNSQWEFAMPVDEFGNLVLDIEIDYFNNYKVYLTDEDGNDIPLKGYDCYRLLPVKNANEVVDVII